MNNVLRAVTTAILIGGYSGLMGYWNYHPFVWIFLLPILILYWFFLNELEEVYNEKETTREDYY